MRGLKVTQETINCVVNKCLSHCVCSCVPILTEISNSATDVSDKRRPDQVQINTSVPIELCVSAQILSMNCVGNQPPPAPPPPPLPPPNPPPKPPPPPQLPPPKPPPPQPLLGPPQRPLRRPEFSSELRRSQVHQPLPPPRPPPPLLIDESRIRMTPRIMSTVQQGLERPPDRGPVPGSSAVPR